MPAQNPSLVVWPTGNNDVSKLLGRHAELLKGRLDVVDVLVEHLSRVGHNMMDAEVDKDCDNCSASGPTPTSRSTTTPP